MGEWIEMILALIKLASKPVSPFMGEWIEIRGIPKYAHGVGSRLSWASGLKSNAVTQDLLHLSLAFHGRVD